jgi:hypothetical protein
LTRDLYKKSAKRWMGTRRGLDIWGEAVDVEAYELAIGWVAQPNCVHVWQGHDGAEHLVRENLVEGEGAV